MDTALAMKTKPILDLTEHSSPGHNQDIGLKGLSGVVRVLGQVLLPHLIAGLGLMLTSVYVWYLILIKPLHLSSGFAGLLVVILLGGIGIAAFSYALIGAGVFALYQASTAWEDFIDHTLELVQEKAISKLEGFKDGVAKTQAKVLIRGSVREVFQHMRQQEMASWPRWIVFLCLGGVMLAMRSVLIARIVKWSGTTIKISKIFAGKATLVGAVFLNLRFFALLLLGLVYMAGGIVLVFNILLLWWIK